MKLALADRDALCEQHEEHSRALSAAHAELENKYKDALFGLRETQDKVRSSAVTAPLLEGILTGCVAWSG